MDRKARNAAYRAAHQEELKIYMAAYHAAHRGEAKARKAAYYLANREKEKARAAAYQKANPEKANARTAKWRARNPEKVKASHAAYYATLEVKVAKAAYRVANRENRRSYFASSYAAHPDVYIAGYHRRRALKRNAEGRFTAEDVKRIRAAQKDKCAVCRVPLKGHGHRDHIVPLVAGGSNWPANIQLLCGSCNCSKGAKDPLVFMRELGRLL
jgi:5-methylcytosine-specific restriction endonuclease McrA